MLAYVGGTVSVPICVMLLVLSPVLVVLVQENFPLVCWCPYLGTWGAISCRWVTVYVSGLCCVVLLGVVVLAFFG